LASLRGEDGVVREKKWAAGAPDLGVARTVPWRTFRWRHGQQHYSGTYWSSVMSGHVIYESRLELARLLYADFDRATEAVFAQPFLLSAQVDGRKRRHVPDFLILRRGRVPLVVDVKPRRLLTRPKVAFSLGWAREAVESRGWEFEAWCEPPEAELANVRFLAGYRRACLLDPELLAEIRGAGLDGATLGEAFRAFPRRPAELVRAGVLHLLWAQHLVTEDLGTPLSARHRLRAGVPAEVRGAGTRELPRPAAESGEGRMPEDGKAGTFERGAYMGQASVRVGVGTRFAYVVEVFASAHGNELLVRDGRDRRFRLSLREALASGRGRVIPEGPGPSSDEPREMASVILGQLTAEALKEVRERAADVNEVLSGYRSGTEELAGPGEPRREYAPGVPLMRRYAAKAASRASARAWRLATPARRSACRRVRPPTGGWRSWKGGSRRSGSAGSAAGTSRPGRLARTGSCGRPGPESTC
jgi:hypothetical protein